MKKRILSCLLICALVLGLCPLGALAAPETAEVTGELRLVVNRAGAVAETEFIARLTTPSGQPYREGRVQAAQGQSECALHLADIADGRYTLTLTAPGYLPYVQDLDFDGRCVQLTLYNYASVNEGRTQADGLFGVFPVGDVNGDKVIDDNDADAIMAAMDSQNAAMDLDGSGTVDLSDLAIAVRNAGSARQATAVHTVSSKVLAKAVTPEAAVGTASGSPLHELLDRQKEDTLVALTPVADAPISESNPVEVALPTSLKITAPEGSAEAAAQAAAATVQAEAIYIAAPSGSQSTIAAGTVTVEGVDQAGNNVTIEAPIGQSAPAPAALSGQAMLLSAQLLAAAPRDVSVEGDGSVIIDLGARVAIKKVTIRVTKTADQGNLAQIAKVEFLSDFAERIPEPQLSIPTVQTVTNTESDGLGYKSLTVTWDPQPNVTGYELSVSGPGYNKTATATGTSHTFVGDSFNGTVKSFQTYQVKVRSVNGDWRSDWSAPYSHTVTCAKTPPAPQYLTATAAVQSLKVSWNCKFDAEWFTLYYKESSAKAYTAVEKLTAPSYTIPNLTGGTRYTMYVVAHNRNGDSPKSQNAEGVPLTPTGVEMPKYKLLNVKDAKGGAMTHIASVTGNQSKPLTLFGGEDWTILMDNDPKTYLEIRDWDNGVAYGGFCGPEVKLDGTYTFDTVRFSPYEGERVAQFDAKLGYRDEAGALQMVNATLSAKADALGRKYYEVVADQPITADHFQLRTRTFNTAPITMAEIKVYQYDDLEHQVADLFADDMRTTLKDTVTREQIDALVKRTNTADPVSRELHPHKEVILADLNYALELLEDSAKLAQVLRVDNLITANGNPQNGFAQALSDYQPLGFVAGAGDTVVLYVSDVDDKTPRGNYVNLNLIATQYHPQVSAWQKSVTRLKAGRNEVTIPKIGSDATERGGSLYLQYTGTRGGNHYDVRLTGAAAIPTLRLDEVTGAERTQAIKNYVNELETYVGTLEAKHEELHAKSTNANVRYAYDPKNCFLNATEITLDNMMYSLPATQAWRALSGAADPTEQLANAIAAMEQQIDYFYQFKGMNRAATDKDAYPFTRLNIRYHQMFTGAFMYAGGKHIGIEFGSAGELFTLSPIVADENGKYVSGRLTGWGIAHEMGHCVNAAAYQRVEVTNNVFAQLAKTGGGAISESNANFRTSYQNVYKAVATGTTGHTGNLAVQLAQYWQLHLAYDNDYAYKFYDTIEAQQAGLFYARLESYLRDRSKATPELSASSGGDQLFMQAACAAAGRDLLHFFTAWGFKPDAATRAYAANFPKESRKIQYIDDDSRLYRLEGKPGMSAGTAVTAAIENAVDRRINGNRVTISLGNTNTNTDAMLGYEICRNGKMVAFVTADQQSYTDIVTTENNKAFSYTVTGIDRLLGETETLELGEVKVCHDGAIDKSGWTAQTNLASPRDTTVEKNDNDPESGAVNGNATPGVETVSAISAALDNDPATVYCGKGSKPYIILDLGGVEQVTALKFTPAAENYTGDAGEGIAASTDLYKYRLFGYKVEVSLDGVAWETVKEGNAYTGNASNPKSWVKQSDVIYNADGSYTLYFSRKNEDGGLDPFLYTYDAAYIRLSATNMSTLAMAELDVLGPTGDNVELIPEGFGRLSSAYKAGKHPDGSDCIIPTGAVVFYGAYKGDPSYNVVILKDQNGKVLDGSQLIFAEVPAKGALGETSDGRWFFWLEDVEKTDAEGDKYNEMDQLADLVSVKTELYRVQDAMALSGQRVTSTSLTMTLPQTLPTITITAADTQGLAYAPSEAMLQAALAGEMEPVETREEAPVAEEGIYGDTGAGETPDAAPVQLAGAPVSVTFTAKPDSLAMAARIDLTLDPATSRAGVLWDTDKGLYTARRYDGESGKLSLYAVARTGGFGGSTLTGKVTDLAAKTTVTATALAELDRLYVLEETELKDASAQAQAKDTTGNKPGSGGGSGSGGSGGSGGGGGGGVAINKIPFADVAQGSWYEEAVRFVQSKGMMVGTSATEFSPELTTSRAMIVTILWRLEGSPAVTAGAADGSFTDVAAGQWYAAAVAWASGKAIVNGMGDGTFAPDAPITREQLAAILYRYAGYKGHNTQSGGSLSGFSDAASVSAYAVDALTWCNAKGLITGMGDGVLAPQGNATRAQAATIFHRFCTTVQK